MTDSYAELLSTLANDKEPLREARLVYQRSGFYPLSFALSQRTLEKYLPYSLQKEREWAPLIPGKMETYIYKKEEDYMQAYSTSWKALTCRKAGFDCWRHLEILASGTIPIFQDSSTIPLGTMFAYPKRLLLLAEAVKEDQDQARLTLLRQFFLQWTKKHLTASAMIAYMIEISGVTLGEGRIAFIDSQLVVMPDYQSISVLFGLMEFFGPKRVDVFYPPLYLYEEGSEAELRRKYGQGFNYIHLLPGEGQQERSQEEMVENLKKGKYEIVIYGSVTRSGEFWRETQEAYAGQAERVWLVDGEDVPLSQPREGSTLFVREGHHLNK